MQATTKPRIFFPSYCAGATAVDIAMYIRRNFGNAGLMFAVEDDSFFVARRSDLVDIKDGRKWKHLRQAPVEEIPALSERIRKWLNRCVPDPQRGDYVRRRGRCEYRASGKIIDNCSVAVFRPLND